MKYLRINTDQGPIYLDKSTKKVYEFPPYFPKLMSWKNLLDLLCGLVFLAAPYMYLRSHNVFAVIGLLLGSTVAVGIRLYFAGKEMEEFYDYFSHADYTHKPNYNCQPALKKQMIKSIRISVLTIVLYVLYGVGAYWMISLDGKLNYIRLFGIFCSGPIIAYWLFALRPVGVSVEYCRYKRWRESANR